MSFVIVRTDVGVSTMFSIAAGRDFASPIGGWVSDPAQALQFARKSDAESFLEKLMHYAAPFCDVRELSSVAHSTLEDSHGL